MSNNSIDMEALLRWLDRGDITRLAKEQYITPRQANNIITGRSRNYSFINRMVAKAEENMRLAQRTQILRENLKLIQ